MKLCSQINEALNEKKITIKLEGKEYQLEVQKGIEALIQYEMDNPDLGTEADYKDDNARKAYYTKQMKGLDVEDVIQLISDYVADDEMSVDKLLKDKVIRK